MKSKSTAIVLALFLGGIGIHRFYLDKPVSGILYLLFCWTLIPAFLAFCEVLSLLSYTREEWDAEYNKTAVNISSVQKSDSNSIGAMEALTELGKLKEAGVLTQAEFDDKKLILLRRIS